MPIKNEEETYEQIIEMGRNNDYTTGNLLDYEYFSKHCKLIPLENLKEMKEQQCFSSSKSQKKQLLNFHKILQQLHNNENAKNCKFIG